MAQPFSNVPLGRVLSQRLLGFGRTEQNALGIYRTVTEEFAATRPAFPWRHLVALARVTASMHGYDRGDNHGHWSPGYEQACKLLGLDVS